MRKGLKFLLCFVFSLFIGIGIINAEDAPNSIHLSEGPSDGNNNGWVIYNIRSGFPFYGKKLDTNNDGLFDRYIFCLDSHKNFAFGSDLSKSSAIYNSQSEIEKQIGNVYARADQFGLGKSNTESHTITIDGIEYTIREDELYAVTQMVIWDIVHPGDTGVNGNGYVQDYQDWINDSDNPERAKVFRELQAARNGIAVNDSGKYTVSLTGVDGMREDGDYLVSNEYTVNAGSAFSSGFEFNVTATSQNTGVQKYVNGQWSNWSSSLTVIGEEKIRVRVLKPTTGVGNVTATVSIGKSGFSGGWAAYFYAAPDQATQQNIALALPVTRNVSSSVTIKGSYVNTVTLKVSKTDATGQKELAGAKLTLKDLQGNIKESWISTEEEHQISGLLAGDIYELIEDYAPDGYAPLQNSIKFVLHDNGKVSTCKNVTNGVCEEMSEEDKLLIKNEVTKLLISKLDVSSGEEIIGAELKICTIEAYNQDGRDCKPDKDEWKWTSGEEPKYIEKLTIGKYVLIETLPADGYEAEMIINDNLTSAYEFDITESGPLKIDVCNKLVGKIKVPNTGISTLNMIAIGGLMLFVGYETIKIYRRKVNAK